MVASCGGSLSAWLRLPGLPVVAARTSTGELSAPRDPAFVSTFPLSPHAGWMGVQQHARVPRPEQAHYGPRAPANPVAHVCDQPLSNEIASRRQGHGLRPSSPPSAGGSPPAMRDQLARLLCGACARRAVRVPPARPRRRKRGLRLAAGHSIIKCLVTYPGAQTHGRQYHYPFIGHSD